MIRFSTRCAAAWLLALSTCFLPDSPAAQESPQQTAERLRWFTEGRYGMFIHWGVYSLFAGEWNGQQTPGGGENIQFNLEIPWADYGAAAAQFDPAEFDAAEWVSVARNAGMKYIVITAKHHDGFSLFDTAHSDWDLTRSSYLDDHVDPLKQLADEARAQGLRFGVYYSFMDWYHHGYSPTGPFLDFTDEEQRQHIRDQVTELIQYLDPDLLWFDAYWLGTWTVADGQALLDLIRGLKPSIVVNNRVIKAREHDGDYVTTERRMGQPGRDYLWESAFPMNETWGYKYYDEEWRSTATLLHMLLYSASRGANHLLNIGPTGAGVIPAASLARLEELGAWLQEHGDAVYATSAGPFGTQPWGWATSRIGKLYLLVSDWPEDGMLRFPALENVVTGTFLMNDELEAPLPLDTSDPAEWVIDVPHAAQDALASVIVVNVVGVPRARPGPVGALVNDSDERISYHGNFWYSANRGYGDFQDDVHASTWQAPDDGSTWLEFEFVGTGIGYVSERNFDQGEVDVYIDDQLVETVDAHATIRMSQEEVFRKLDLPMGTHRIKLVKRSARYLVLDGFRVYLTAVSPGHDLPRPVHLRRSGDPRDPAHAP